MLVDQMEQLRETLAIHRMSGSIIIFKTQPLLTRTVTAKMNDGWRVLQKVFAQVVDSRRHTRHDSELVSIVGTVAGMLDDLVFFPQMERTLILWGRRQDQDGYHRAASNSKDV